MKTEFFKQLEAWLNRSRQIKKSIKTEKQRLEKETNQEVSR